MKFSRLKTVLGVLLISGIYISCTQQTTKSGEEDFTRFVDPYIGSGGHGHVFVGASVPFGGVQVGPSNINKGWDWCSAYHYSDSIVKGFAHLHLSGTGISDLSDFLLMPAVGELKTSVGTQENHLSGYASKYSHENEKVAPGYYSLLLDRYNIKVEITATERVGFHRISFPKSDSARLIMDLHEGNAETATETFFKRINDSTFAGYRFSTGWAANQREYFAMVISKPAESLVIYNDADLIPGDSAQGKSVKGFIGFKTINGEQIMVKVGVSPVSMNNALANIQAEIPGWDFEATYLAGKQKWNDELGKIKINTHDERRKNVFYTAMYHTMIAPHLFNDHNQDYRALNQSIVEKAAFNNYSIFSLWDTYRTLHPLFTITQQERLPDIINSMLAIYQQQGKLPIWHLRGNETNTMVGYSAVPVVVDACLKGIEGIDLNLAYEAVKNSALNDFEPGIKEMREYGYIPADLMHESVARAMEYAISDWAIAALAHKLGNKDDAELFMNRAKAYRNYFDSTDRFMKGKMLAGSWRTPFNPFSAQHRVNDYCEGNAWQYLWLVPQDPEGLIALLGGDEAFTAKLDSLFSLSPELEAGASADITGLIGQYAHGNEPSHHITYLYAFAGQQYKTAEKVNYIMDNLYTHQQDGLSGNEDCGQMSAWYVMSALGFYPVNPANGVYVFGSPQFEAAEIVLPDGKTFSIYANDVTNKNRYIQSVKLNGESYSKSYITHKEIMKGGRLEFVMGEEPNREFGSKPSDRPASLICIE